MCFQHNEQPCKSNYIYIYIYSNGIQKVLKEFIYTRVKGNISVEWRRQQERTKVKRKKT
jgi:hypothetical protein